MKRILTRICALAAAVALLAAFFVLPSSARRDGTIKDVSVDAVFTHTGNVRITEVWTVDVPDNWTEMYTVKGELRDMDIQDLEVRDRTTKTQFEYTGDDWDYERSREYKAGKCGTFVDEDDAVELCWGVGSSGPHVFEVSYTMTNAMQSFKDGVDGFHIRFINEGLSSVPEHVKVTVSGLDKNGKALKFSKENTKFWSFGLEGNSVLEDGKVVVESTGAVQYCNVLMRFDDGMFAPTSQNRKTFEKMLKRAMKGSDYKRPFYENPKVYGTVLVGALAAAFSISAVRRRGLYPGSLKKKDLKEADYYRLLPFKGDLLETYTVVNEFGLGKPKETGMISAYLIKWMQCGGIQFRKTGDKETPEMTIIPDKLANLDGKEEKLFRILSRAAGDDRTLQEKELEEYAKEHSEEIKAFVEEYKEAGIQNGVRNGTIQEVDKRFFTGKDRVNELTAAGETETLHTAGFLNFLKDFTIIQEREPTDAKLWGDYLVYAALYGIADEVAASFEKLVPDYFKTQFAEGAGVYEGTYYPHTFVWLNSYADAAHAGYLAGVSKADMKSASAGGGGFTSFGGGGGFSGGGFGGGGR